MRKSDQRRLQIKVKTPGARTVVHFRKKKIDYHKCGVCGCKLNRARLSVSRLKKLPKVQRRPERPYPELCSRCMREKIKERLK